MKIFLLLDSQTPHGAFRPPAYASPSENDRAVHPVQSKALLLLHSDFDEIPRRLRLALSRLYFTYCVSQCT